MANLNLNSNVQKIIVKPDQIQVTYTGATTNLINVGTGEEIYAGLNGTASKIRSIKAGNGASVSTSGDTIIVGIDTTILNSKLDTSIFDAHSGDTSIHFAQSAITITENQVTNLVNDLASKSNTGHTHNYAPALTNDENYVTDAELQVLQNTSGTNSGDQIADGTTITGTGTQADPFVAHIVVTGDTPTVQSINGKTGIVLLYTDDVTVTGTTNQYASATEKSIWNSKQPAGDYASTSGLTNHTGDTSIHYVMSAITVTESQVTNLVSDLASKSNTGHTHTEYSPTGHTHSQYGLQADLTTHTGDTSIHFAQSAITITESQVTGLVDDLASKSNTGHTHTQYALETNLNSHTGNTSIHFVQSAITITESQVTNLVNDLGYLQTEIDSLSQIQGTNRIYNFEHTASDIATYETLNQQFISGATSEVIVNNSTTVLVDSYITIPLTGVEITGITAGVWVFHYHVSANQANNANMRFNVYKRTSGGTETLLFQTPLYPITSTSTLEYQQTVSQNQYTGFVSSDRIVIKVYTVCTEDRTITWSYGSATNNAYVQLPIQFSSAVLWSNVEAKPAWLDKSTLGDFQTGHTHSQYGLQTDLVSHSGNTIIHLTPTEKAIISGVTASAAELNVLDGIPAGLTATELGYVNGVTASIQTQLNARARQADLDTHTGNTAIHFAQSAITITESQVTGLVNDLASKSNTGHTHSQYGLQADLSTHSGDTSIHFAQSAITITESQVTNLVNDLAGKASTGHTHSGMVTETATQTLTNKRITKRVGTTTSSATPTINSDNVDIYSITAQTEAITSFTTNLSGTPTDGQLLWIQITGTAARAITWGTSFEASTVALPTTTVTTARLDVGFVWNTGTSKWRCIASA